MSNHAGPKIRALEHVLERMIASGPHAAKLKAEVARLKTGLAALDVLRDTAHPLDSTPAHIKRVAGAAAKFVADTQAAHDRLHGIVRDGLRDIDQRTQSKVDLRPDQYAAEIRAQFRSLDSKAQFALLGELVDANRGQELAAFIAAPALLTGLPAEVLGRYREAIIAKHAPLEFAEQGELMEAFRTALDAAAVVRDAAGDFADPAKLESIERGEAAAAAADRAFAGALSHD